MENSKPLTNTKMSHTFSRYERLHQKERIEELFKNGSSHFLYPYLIKIRRYPRETSLHSILISVPKKNFKKAVDRNFLKRRIREIYRQHKEILYPSDTNYDIAIVYTGKEVMDFKVMKSKLIKILKRLPIKV